MEWKRPFLHALGGVLFFFATTSHAAYEYSGTVKNAAGAGIGGATVSLSGTAASVKTNGNGTFILIGSSTGVRPPSAALPSSCIIMEIGKKGIDLYGQENQAARCIIYDLAGRKQNEFEAQAGRHASFRFSFTGCRIALVQSGDFRTTLRLVGLRNAIENRTVAAVKALAPQGAVGKVLVSDPASPAQYLCAAMTGYYPGTAWVAQDTMSSITITLIDTASYQSGLAYLNPSLPFSTRVQDLVSRLTLTEKASLMMNTSSAVSRLSIPAYNWWSEALHGVARSGLATSFPNPTGLAATFDTAAIYEMASIISTEARAKYNGYLAAGQGGQQYGGITFWSPLMDIARDPRWGRVLETYGEDPFLTSRIGGAFIRGMQGSDPRYLKVSAASKHFAAHSGPEVGRTTFNAIVSLRDLQDTYFPTFISAIKESNVETIMCAYIQVNGVYSCSNPWLLDTMIRKTWGFKGHIVSDCGATALVQAGCDLGCSTFSNIATLVNNGTLPQWMVDTALKRTLMTRFKLGMFDPSQMVPFSSIPASVVNCQRNIAYACTMSCKSMVLLRNQNNILPLSSSIKKIAVVGPNAEPPADSVDKVMLGNYYGYPAAIVLPLDGIRTRAAAAGMTVNYAQGCSRTGTNYSGFSSADSLARASDVVIAVLGLSSEVQLPSWSVTLEGETIDRMDLRLPPVQDSLLTTLVATGKPVIVVLLNGGSLSIDNAAAHAGAIVEAWYPGEQGGNAIAKVLFGDYNPAGRLPMTFYPAATTFPSIDSMSMKNRTYRYFSGSVLYPFGYGLSYTTFGYTNLTISPGSCPTNQSVNLTVGVTNSGSRDGEEVVEVYVTAPASSSTTVPTRSLAAFRRVAIKAGQTATVGFTLNPGSFSTVNSSAQRAVEPGTYSICVGGGQPVTVNNVIPSVQLGTLTLTGSEYIVQP